MTPPHSTNGPDDSHSATYMNARFVSFSPIEITIHHIEDHNHDHAMKQIDSSASLFPSLFQIAAFFEDFFPNGGFRGSMPARQRLPFEDVMSSPEKLIAALTAAKTEETTAERPRPKSSAAPKRATRSARRSDGGGNDGNGGSGDPNNYPNNLNGNSLKKVEFVLDAPAANSVKLAADFTDWERSPLEMMHSPDGKWFTVVPLAPGRYAYRYIVDGQWFDDPANRRHAPNPFGTENAVITVA
jgi:hypothetical protein